MRNGCIIGNPGQHLPTAWATSPYVPKYELTDAMPDEAIYRWETYGPVACTHVCPWARPARSARDRGPAQRDAALL